MFHMAKARYTAIMRVAPNDTLKTPLHTLFDSACVVVVVVVTGAVAFAFALDAFFDCGGELPFARRTLGLTMLIATGSSSYCISGKALYIRYRK